jgi:predicted PurR-regulated permease PerM
MIELTTRPVIRQLLLVCFVIGISLATWLVLTPFLVPLAWAAILAYTSWPLYLRLHRLLAGRSNLSSLLMTLAMSMAIVLPMIWLALAIKNGIPTIEHVVTSQLAKGGFALPAFVTHFPILGPEIEAWYDRIANDPAQLRNTIHSLLENADQLIIGLIGGIGRNSAKMGFALLILFFAYRNGEKFMNQLTSILESMLGERVHGYIQAAGGVTRGVVYGIILTALTQGAVAGMGYWIVGLEAWPILAGITTVFAMIPFGTPLVWGSLGIWLLLTDQTWHGVFLLIWGAIAVSWIDNIIRPIIVAQNVNIPFILAFFGVLGGLSAFGLIGLFLGPVILAIGFAVWQEWLQGRPSDR